jgi:hypothetical protein
MHELRLVAVSEDGSYAILAVPGRGGRFSLPIDDRLRTVARGQFSRLAQYEIEVENPLRPKEIQDRIRAGETADEIADAAGIPIDRVRRFEGPVLAEREYRAQEAQRATVRSPGDSGPGPRLGDIVAERLIRLGANPDDATWDSWKRSDGNWQVRLVFTTGSRSQTAEWVFDPRRRHIAPDDDQATRLCLPEDDLSAPSLHATVTPIAPRLSGFTTHRDVEQRVPAAVPAPAPGPGTQAGPAPAPAPAVISQRTPEPAPAVISQRTPEPAPAAASQRAPEPAPAERPAAELDKTAEAAPSQPQPRERPARKAAGGRGRRASMPSWDEIMLGNSREPD